MERKVSLIHLHNPRAKHRARDTGGTQAGMLNKAGGGKGMLGGEVSWSKGKEVGGH